MNNSKIRSAEFVLRPLAAVVALALVSGGAAAQTVSGTITVNGAVQGTPQNGSVISDSIIQPAASASYIGDATSGVFGVSAGHSGIPGSTQSAVTYTRTITNSSAIAQSVSFSFFVFHGEISARAGLDTSGASFAAGIDWGGQSLWGTRLDLTNGRFYIPDVPTATVTNSVSAADFSYVTSQSSTDSFAYLGSWGDYAKTLGLGILNPGESKTLTYTMSTLSYSGSNNYAGYGGSAGYGSDPLSFDMSPLPGGVAIGVSMAAAPVPEPSTCAMLGLGLAALGFVNRRRRAERGRPV